jgi:hypothetical protein
MYESKDYIINQSISREELRFHPDTDGQVNELDPNILLQALIKSNEYAEFQIGEFNNWKKKGMPSLWDLIPPKNKSGSMGEMLGVVYCSIAGIKIVKNPKEAGSPDFFPLCEQTKAYMANSEKKEGDKKKNTYTGGGFDTKGCMIAGRLFTSMKPSSHHTQTSSILLSSWDYEGDFPKILSVCYSNDINENDWKAAPQTQPETEEGKSKKITNSAYFLPSGMEKIRRNWLILHKSVKPPKAPEDIVKWRLESFVAFRNRST